MYGKDYEYLRREIKSPGVADKEMIYEAQCESSGAEILVYRISCWSQKLHSAVEGLLLSFRHSLLLQVRIRVPKHFPTSRVRPTQQSIYNDSTHE